MKVETVVLRVPSRRRLPDLVATSGNLELMVDASRSVAADIVRAEDIEVQVDELTQEQARDVERRDDTVAATAPIMPISLVRPAGRNEAEGEDRISWGLAAIGADRIGPEAGQGVKVAVLDTGLDRGHIAFSAISKDAINFRNFLSEDDRDFQDEPEGHGTHCAGTIFGQDVDGRRIGIARGVRRALIGKVLGPRGGSSEQIYRALSWAISEGARVISMSISIDFTGYRERLVARGVNPIAATSMALAAYRSNIRLFDRMSQITGGEAGAAAGAVVVVAGGNESDRDDYTVAAAPPAAAEKFISVGALGRRADGSLGIARFSNTGVNLVAPGVDILSAKAKGGLVLMDGTSMAAPHVAGIAVLMAEKMGPGFNASVLRQKLLAGAAPKDGIAEADVGAGLVRVPV